MKLLENLYYGRINPSDEAVPTGGEYTRLMNRLNNLYEKMSVENQDIFQEYEDTYQKLNALCEKESFESGFCLGIKLMLSALLEQ